MKIQVINGPNLNLQGKREPQIYGRVSLEDLAVAMSAIFPTVDFKWFQSNSEGAIIDAIHKAGFDPDCAGIILNAGAYSHYSYAIADAVRAVPAPVAEVHLSNIYAREEFRRRSVLSSSCICVVAGMGPSGYEAAARFLIDHINQPQ